VHKEMGEIYGLKKNLSQYRILGWNIFSFSTFSSFHCLLTFTVAIEQSVPMASFQIFFVFSHSL